MAEGDTSVDYVNIMTEDEADKPLPEVAEFTTTSASYTWDGDWSSASFGEQLVEEPNVLDILSEIPYKPRKLRRQNLPYKLLGIYVVHLAGMGATDSELQKLMAKGKSATLLDVAKIYCKHLEEGDGE